MYSGTTIRRKSGRLMGAHQKIDRVARRHLTSCVPRHTFFPSIREILHFEGLNGPDGIKRKSPGTDELWHFIDPSNHDDRQILQIIDDHIHNLSAALSVKDTHRSAFEAAWLAHAIVDGLTPAHHYPLEEKLEELRGGEGLDTRDSIKNKVIMPGENRRHQFMNNWEYWGAKGVMTTHFMFEIGVASTITPLKLDDGLPSGNLLIRAKQEEFTALYMEYVQTIHAMKLYDIYRKKGWSRSLAHRIRKDLAPMIVQMVVLAWYIAAQDAATKRKARG